MKNILTFIIPIRHPDNCVNKESAKKNLAQTIQSISSQENPNWKAIIVANHGTDLPPLPKGFEVKWVDLPANTHIYNGETDKEAFYDALRNNKGQRVLAGMLHAGATEYFMTVDDDDFVSSKLAGFVAENGNQTANGWYIPKGYVWGDGGKLLYIHPKFFMFCGTSHIIRADLYHLPASVEDATEDYIKHRLGSHISIAKHLEDTGTPLQPLPFIGALYRIGHSGSYSRSSGLIDHIFDGTWLLKYPKEIMRRISRMRLLSGRVQKEFFGKL